MTVDVRTPTSCRSSFWYPRTVAFGIEVEVARIGPRDRSSTEEDRTTCPVEWSK